MSGKETKNYTNGASVLSAQAADSYEALAVSIQKILRETSLPAILNTICEEACRVLRADRSLVSRFYAEGPKTHETITSHNIPEDYMREVENLEKAPLLKDIMESGEKLQIVSDLSSDPRAKYRDHIVKAGHRTTCAISLGTNDAPFGALFIYHLSIREYSPEDKKLASTIGALASIAIEKIIRLEEEKNRVKQFALVGKIAEAAGSPLEPGELFKKIAQEIRTVIPCERFVIARTNEKANRYQYLHIESDVDLPALVTPDALFSRFRLDDPKGFFLEVYETNTLKNCPDIREIDLEPAQEMAKVGFRSALFVPILREGKAFAHFGLASRKVGTFTREHEDLITIVAQHLGPAIRNATLYQSAEQRSFRLNTLAKIHQKISESLSLKDTLESIAQAAVTLLDADHSRIFLCDEAKNELQLQAFAGPIPYPEEEGRTFRLDETLAGKTFRSEKPYITHNIQDEPVVRTRKWARKHGIHAFMGYPLRSSGRTIGIINCTSRNRDQFLDEDVDVLAAFAAQAAIAIENAQLHEKEKTSRSFFQSVVGDSADAIIITDLERKIIFWNSGAENLYHWQGIEMLGKSPAVIVPERELLMSAEKYHKVRSEGVSLTFEMHYRRKDDVEVPVLITLSPVKNIEGKIIAVTGFHKDLSSARQAADALRESEEKFRSLVESAPDALFVSDSEGKFVDVNRRACDSLGYTREELLAMRISDIEIKYPFDKIREKRAARPFGTTETLDGVHKRKDGSTFPIEVHARNFELAGRVVALSIVRDVSEQKRSEEVLRLAKEEAEKANLAKSEFLSNLSHELRSPLNAVIGFSDLLELTLGDNPNIKYALKIKESGNQLVHLIDDLLHLDRIETGKVILELHRTTINALVSSIGDSRRDHLPEHFTLETKLDAACGEVRCDSARVTQILTNLIDNAIKYSPEGGAIHLRTKAKESEIWISVEDDGVGIPVEKREVIFERFRQIKSETGGHAGGLGIGLGIVKKLVEFHGGRIWLESQPGKGSVFTFSLPLDTAEEHIPLPLPGRDSSENAWDNEPWAKKSVLVVDDHQHLHEYMRLLMRSARNVLSAFDGEAGIQMARSEQPDIVIMDLRMPVMNGLEATRILKADAETRDIPIIAVSAQAMPEDRESCFSAGATGFVSKPVDIALLRKELTRALST
ncbi:MAG: GAF domain-containing protein [bacterium]|nr:GAF domain-containing protein [bacterium]